MNDTLRTNVFVRFQAETIACACIYLAARALQVRKDASFSNCWCCFFTVCTLYTDLCIYFVVFFPNIKSFRALSTVPNILNDFQIPLPSRPHWYLLFGASEDEIKDICITTLRLYTRKKVRLTTRVLVALLSYQSLPSTQISVFHSAWLICHIFLSQTTTSLRRRWRGGRCF